MRKADKRQGLTVGAAFAVVAAMVVAAWGGASNAHDNSAHEAAGGSASADAQAITDPPDPTLAQFYSQELSWENCGIEGEEASAQCTWVNVPINYASPDAGTTRLRVLRVPARGGQAPRGALFVNPGGPGGSATEYAKLADWIVSNNVRKNFDVVGIDPRGVGKSEPIVCVDGAFMDTMMAADPTPDDEAEIKQGAQLQRRFGEACKAKNPKLLGHVSTVEAAKDTDVVRALLGQPKLNWLGKSYGTVLGTTYAGLYPQRVGAMVLDGALPPSLTNEETGLGQAKGFEAATRAWAKFCADSGECPMGSNVDEVMKNLKAFLTGLDSKPIPISGDVRVKELTEGWATTGALQAMYTQTYWGTLTESLRAAKAGDGRPLFDLAEQYAGRGDDGTYDSNIMQINAAVNCVDRSGAELSTAQMNELVAAFTKEAPTWGAMMAHGTTACADWPVPATGKAEKIPAKGSGPIVVVGTTRDPATPYEWAEQLAQELSAGHLITYDGDGHTAYMSSNGCVDRAVDAYLINGTVPPDGLQC